MILSPDLPHFCHDTCILHYIIIYRLTTLCTKPNQIFLYHSYELNKDVPYQNPNKVCDNFLQKNLDLLILHKTSLGGCVTAPQMYR